VSTRFLLVRLGSLGDVIHGIPVAAALRARYPDAEIDWLVDPRYLEVLRLVPAVSRAIPIDPRGSKHVVLRTIGELRRRRYHAVLDLQGLIKSAVLARAAGGVRTIGLARPHLREGAARLFYTTAVDPGDVRHVIFKNLALLQPLGIHEPRVEFPLLVPDTAASRDVAARSGGRYALLNPGAAWPNKRWPPERFGAVAETLRRSGGVRSFVLWGPGEQSIADAVVSSSHGAAELAPQTTITDLFAMAKGARLVVSGDTGPLHVAAAVGAPVVALFGPTFPERNGPWAADDIILSRVHTCECLYERRCRRATPCIDDISVDEVTAAARKRVAAGG
jgi:lipopolysaccharide heptosyltransferase I